MEATRTPTETRGIFAPNADDVRGDYLTPHNWSTPMFPRMRSFLSHLVMPVAVKHSSSVLEVASMRYFVFHRMTTIADRTLAPVNGKVRMVALPRQLAHTDYFDLFIYHFPSR
jgi:hypothetical protein